MFPRRRDLRLIIRGEYIPLQLIEVYDFRASHADPITAVNVICDERCPNGCPESCQYLHVGLGAIEGGKGDKRPLILLHFTPHDGSIEADGVGVSIFQDAEDVEVVVVDDFAVGI